MMIKKKIEMSLEVAKYLIKLNKIILIISVFSAK